LNTIWIINKKSKVKSKKSKPISKFKCLLTFEF
jgi:hypothetical protein